MPIGVVPNPGFNVSPVNLISPSDHSIIFSSAPVTWGTVNANHMPGAPVHFQVQIALTTDPTFVSPVVEGRSWLDVNLFEYESSFGVWSPLPASGLAESDFGKNVRYNEPSLGSNSFLWRVRILEFI